MQNNGASAEPNGLSQAEPEMVSALSGFDPSRARLLGAFSGKWEQLGSVAARLGAAWPITAARKLRSDGLLESRYCRNHYEWRLTRDGALKAIAMEARQGGDRATGLHPKDDSAGAKHIAQQVDHA